MKRLASVQEEERLRRQCDERCAKLVSDGGRTGAAAVAAHKSSTSAETTDSRPAAVHAESTASCNGSPTMQQRQSAGGGPATGRCGATSPDHDIDESVTLTVLI